MSTPSLLSAEWPPAWFLPEPGGLWAYSSVQRLRTDPSAVSLLVTDDRLVCVERWAIASGRLSVPTGSATDLRLGVGEQIGEFTVTRSDGRAGMSAVGWWAPLGPGLQMQVLGLELWDAGRRLVTEDRAVIAALRVADAPRPHQFPGRSGPSASIR